MAFLLNLQTEEISEVSRDLAERKLADFGWSNWIRNDFHRSARVLAVSEGLISTNRHRLESEKVNPVQVRCE